MKESGDVGVWVEEELIPIRDKVYNFLKNSILNGDYNSGERLIERELAEKLKISRTPVREALFRLESQGFVKTIPRKGVVVSEISTEEVMEVFTILSSLQVLAVKLAIQRTDDKTRKNLMDLKDKIDGYLKNGISTDTSSLHMEITETLYKSSKSPRLTEMIQGLYENIRAFANIGYEIPGRMKESIAEHRDVIMAIQNGESELAEYLTRIHIEKSRKAYMAVINKMKHVEE